MMSRHQTAGPGRTHAFKTAVVTAALAAVLAAGRDASGSDVLIRRDDSHPSGALQSCTSEVCVLNGKHIARSSIAWIGLRRQPPPPEARDPLADEVHLTDASVHLGKLLTINAASVITDKGAYPRAEVEWIHLGGGVGGSTRGGGSPVGDWVGSLDWSSEQQVPAGTQHFGGHLDLALNDDGSGKLTGTLQGNQTQTLDLSVCPSKTVTPGTVKAKLAGTRSAETMSLQVSDVEFTPPDVTPCPKGGKPGTAGVILRFPTTQAAFEGLRKAADGSYRYEREVTIPRPQYPLTVRYELILKQAKK